MFFLELEASQNPPYWRKMFAENWNGSSIFSFPIKLFNRFTNFFGHFFPVYRKKSHVYMNNFAVGWYGFWHQKRISSQNRFLFAKILKSCRKKLVFSPLVKKTLLKNSKKINERWSARDFDPVPVSHIAAMLVHFSLTQAANHSSRFCISWQFQKKKIFQLVIGMFFFQKTFRTKIKPKLQINQSMECWLYKKFDQSSSLKTC